MDIGSPFESKRPTPFQAISHVFVKLHSTKPLEDEQPATLSKKLKLTAHIVQRTMRLLGTCALRAAVPHPLGWPVSQEVLCMMMYGILQSREVPAWRAFFGAVGDLQAWVPVEKQQVVTGACSSWWIRLRPEAQPQNPKAHINWVFFHGGAFVAGHALMYLGSYSYWLHQLAKAGVCCSILSVEYPLAPEHPFPSGVEAAAGVIEWLVRDSEETAPYLVGGDSAGGNLTVAALSLLRDQGRLSTLPLALTLLSPAMDLSDTSAFGRKEPVSSHIDLEEDEGTQQQAQQRDCSAEAAPDWNFQQQNGLKQPEQQETQSGSTPTTQTCKPSQHSQHHHTQSHSLGGSAGPWQLLKGLAGELADAWAAHHSSAAAQAAAARGWFDYLPGPVISDDLHHYLHDPRLLVNPLVSPTYLATFRGLCQQGMLVVAGGAELMRPDIAAFAAKVAADGVAAQYHEEANEPHSYMVLAMPHLLKKAGVMLQYVEQVACGAQG